MKLCNFASLDPYKKARKIKGLKNVSNADRVIWEEFLDDNEKLAIESQRAIEELAIKKASLRKIIKISPYEKFETETTRETKVRLAQNFFRGIVLASYGYECAICRLNVVELINASHIIPWRQDFSRRVDPTNGLALCALHDRAFDRGFFTISSSLKVIISKRVKYDTTSRLQRIALLEIDGIRMEIPERFEPDAKALQYHRDNIFIP